MADLERARIAAEELIELAREALDYTPEYFREKWDMDQRWAESCRDLRVVLGFPVNPAGEEKSK